MNFSLSEHDRPIRRAVHGLLAALSLASAAHCRSEQRGGFFNRNAAAAQPDRVLAELKLEAGNTVADLGSGGGYYTVRFAQAVGPNGHVYAVDVDEDFLKTVRSQSAAAGQNNVTTVLATTDDSRLPDAAVDLLFTRNVYHHLENRVEYMRTLRRVLKPGARVAVIDHNGAGFFSLMRLFGHYTAPETLRTEMRAAGYVEVSAHDFLNAQSFMIFAVGES